MKRDPFSIAGLARSSAKAQSADFDISTIAGGIAVSLGRSPGLLLGAVSRALCEMAERGEIVRVQRGKGCVPSIYRNKENA